MPIRAMSVDFETFFFAQTIAWKKHNSRRKIGFSVVDRCRDAFVHFKMKKRMYFSVKFIYFFAHETLLKL